MAGPTPTDEHVQTGYSVKLNGSVEWASVIFLVSVLTVVAQDAGLGGAG